MTKPITLEELRNILRVLVEHNEDPETNHIKVDRALIVYIDDPEITQLWNKLNKWYS